MAVDAREPDDPRYLGAVIDVALRGLPHAFRDVPAEPGASLGIDVDGPSGGQWTLVREAARWTLWCGIAASPTARVRVADVAAWQILFNALRGTEAERAVQIEGRVQLARAILHARSVIV
jgi:hypothetical protein